MGIDIRIRIDLSPWQKKVVRGVVVVGATIAALGVGIAIASPIDTSWIATGQPMTAGNLLGNLNGLQQQITAGRFVLTGADGGVSYSVGATQYCGITTTSFTGNIGGYDGAKQQCELTCGSPTAHMCLGDELVRSVAVGATLPSAQMWYSSGVGGIVTSGGSAVTVSDCDGWTTAVSNTDGAYWAANIHGPYVEGCNTSSPLACCD